MEKEIQQRNEIIALLNNIRLKHLPVTLMDNDKKYVINGFITRADTNSFAVFFDRLPDLLPVKNIKITFDYNRSFYSSSATNVKLLNMSLKSLEVSLPEKLYYHSIRKFNRFRIPEDLEFNIKRIETSTPETSSINVDELPATLRNIYLELQVENPDIKKIIGMIGEELSKYSNRFRINLFKELDKLSPLEKVVNIYKKTFWVGDTENLNNYVHLGDKYSIIGYEKYFELIGKKTSPDILEQIRQSYISRGIASYAMVPIIVGDRVVGIIEVSVPDDLKYKKLTIYEIFYIKGLADILGEVVVKSHGEVHNANLNFKVVDLSIGGILANTKNIYLTHSIKENNIVLVNLKAENKEIDIPSRVVRYHYMPGDNAGLNVAFEFIYDDESKKLELSNLLKKYAKASSEGK